MFNKTFNHPVRSLAYLGFGAGLFATSASAAIVNVDISASWSAADFTVTAPPNPVDPANDGAVFGVSPSAGSTTIQLIVDTSSMVSYSAGYTYNYLGTDYTLAHDWYGYQNVTLANPYSFGSASWTSADILTGLVGVDGLSAALWTDSDITSSDPSRASFRMTGIGDGLSADLFVGSRTPAEIGSQFLLWEYFGEEIRVDGYTVTASVVPVPAAAWLFGSGILGLVGVARRKV